MFTPRLNTLWRRDLNKNIPDSIKNGGGVEVFSGFRRRRENNLRVEDGGLKAPIPEPVKDDFQKIQGGNGQQKSGSHPLDGLLKGFEDGLF